MSLLRTEPPAPVETLEELFAIAHAMEREAAARYAEIADRMRKEGNPRLAQVFERLSAEEQGHVDSVVHWSESRHGKAPDPSLVRWELPQTFDDEGTETTDPRLVSAYRALAMAVRNEERAFAFWSYVAAHAEAPEIRNAAETMAREELGHVATLRRERRHAFHAERPDVETRVGDRDSLVELAALERRMASLLDDLAGTAASPRREGLAKLAEQARESAAELERLPVSDPVPARAQPVPEAPIAMAELLTDRLLETADRVRDEDALNSLQVLAARAIQRLAWLRDALPEVPSR